MMRSTGLAMAFSAVLAGAALADDVTDAIEAGRKAYADGELAKAKEALGLASQLIGQKHAEAYAKLLPAPLVGWKVDEVEIEECFEEWRRDHMSRRGVRRLRELGVA